MECKFNLRTIAGKGHPSWWRAQRARECTVLVAFCVTLPLMRSRGAAHSCPSCLCSPFLCALVSGSTSGRWGTRLTASGTGGRYSTLFALIARDPRPEIVQCGVECHLAQGASPSTASLRRGLTSVPGDLPIGLALTCPSLVLCLDSLLFDAFSLSVLFHTLNHLS